MITGTNFEEYVMLLKDCSMLHLLQMNECIAKELASRYEGMYHKKYFLPEPEHYSEISRLKSFTEAIDRMLTFPKNKERQDIAHDDLIDMLHFSGFSTNDAKYYIKKAMGNGQIYESRAGHYAKP